MKEFECYKKLYGTLAYAVTHHDTYAKGIKKEGMWAFQAFNESQGGNWETRITSRRKWPKK